MKGGVRVDITSQCDVWDYTQWRVVCYFTSHHNEKCETIFNEWWCESLTSHHKEKCETVLNEWWCESLHHITMRSVRLYSMNDGVRVDITSNGEVWDRTQWMVVWKHHITSRWEVWEYTQWMVLSWCESWHHITMRSVRPYSMNGGVRLYIITSRWEVWDYIQWMVVWELTSHQMEKCETVLNEWWCETSHHITMRSVRIYSMNGGVMVWELTSHHDEKCETIFNEWWCDGVRVDITSQGEVWDRTQWMVVWNSTSHHDEKCENILNEWWCDGVRVDITSRWEVWDYIQWMVVWELTCESFTSHHEEKCETIFNEWWCDGVRVDITSRWEVWDRTQWMVVWDFTSHHDEKCETIFNEWWCESWHHIKWRSVRPYSMNGGVKQHITSRWEVWEYTQWMVVWWCESWHHITMRKCETIFNEWWCESWHVRVYITSRWEVWNYIQWMVVWELTSHHKEKCETVLNEWWCESLHHITMRSVRQYSMSGGVRLDIITMRSVRPVLNEWWCETSHHITMRSVRLYSMNGGVMVWELTSHHKEKCETVTQWMVVWDFTSHHDEKCETIFNEWWCERLTSHHNEKCETIFNEWWCDGVRVYITSRWEKCETIFNEWWCDGVRLDIRSRWELWDRTQWMVVWDFTSHHDEKCETIFNEWWCESWHHIMMRSVRLYSMNGGVWVYTLVADLSVMAAWLLSFCVAICASRDTGFGFWCFKTHCNGCIGCMDVAWASFWGKTGAGNLVFPSKVAPAGDERYLVCAAGAAALQPVRIGAFSVFCNEWLFMCA